MTRKTAALFTNTQLQLEAGREAIVAVRPAVPSPLWAGRRQTFRDTVVVSRSTVETSQTPDSFSCGDVSFGSDVVPLRNEAPNLSLVVKIVRYIY